ncbi:MAG: CU044_2847 family protein [Bacteroidota bacterium]
MPEIKKVLIKDNNSEYELYIESIDDQQIYSEDESSYRSIDLPTLDLKKVHNTIKGYAQYAIGAFVDFGLAEIEELNLEFNLKLAGELGIPVLTKSSTEGSFKIQVKCKFPNKENVEE